MSKLNKEEFKTKYAGLEDKELLTGLLEDIEDSINDEQIDPEELAKVTDELESVKSNLDDMTSKYNELQDKYISRFTETDEAPKKEETDSEEDKVLDIKEI